MNGLKKATAYVLVFVIVLMTMLAILGIWGIVDMEDIILHSLQSLFVVFVSSVVVLFIFTVLIKENTPKKKYFEEKNTENKNNGF